MSDQLSFDDLLADLPVIPYRGTGGWSGTSTSRSRAEEESTNGSLSQRQEAVLAALFDHPRGRIWSEIAATLNLHHGQASGALSNLHSAGLVFQTTTPRHRCLPYVHHRFRHLHDERRDHPTSNKRGMSTSQRKMIQDALDELVALFGDRVLDTVAYRNLRSIIKKEDER